MELSLKGKTALVCGSSQGIGLAIAQELALLGARCILLARNEATLKDAIGSLSHAAGQQHSYAFADFADNAAVKKAAAMIVAHGPVHILINNTGGPAPGLLFEEASDKLEMAFQQHIVNYQILAQAVIPGMKEEGYGRIINIVSTSVKVPIPGLGVSNTIRAATAAWAKTLSLELAKSGITVNNVLPGYTDTKRLASLIEVNSTKQGISKEELIEKMKAGIPAHRFAKAEEVAALAAFLSSPAAAYINGTSIPVDGGSTGAF